MLKLESWYLCHCVMAVVIENYQCLTPSPSLSRARAFEKDKSGSWIVLGFSLIHVSGFDDLSPFILSGLRVPATLYFKIWKGWRASSSGKDRHVSRSWTLYFRAHANRCHAGWDLQYVPIMNRWLCSHWVYCFCNYP